MKELLKPKDRHGGFTLIELMVVVIIIGILAAVAVPLYTAQSRRAKASEAVTGLGAIRSSERVYYSENGAYLAVDAGKIQNDPDDANPGLGLDFSDNKYFDNPCFSVTLDATYGFIAKCDGSKSTAPAKDEVTNFRVEMRGKGGEVRYSYDGGTSWTSWK